MKTTGVSCIPKFGLLVLLGHSSEQPFLLVLGFVPMGFGQVIAGFDCAFMYALKSSQTFMSQCVVRSGCWLAMLSDNMTDKLYIKEHVITRALISSVSFTRRVRMRRTHCVRG